MVGTPRKGDNAVIGLLGVIVGALLSGAITWWQAAVRARPRDAGCAANAAASCFRLPTSTARAKGGSRTGAERGAAIVADLPDPDAAHRVERVDVASEEP